MPDAHFERNKAMLRVSLLFTALACGDAFMAPVSKPFIATPRVATAPVMFFGFGGCGKSVSRGIRRGGRAVRCAEGRRRSEWRRRGGHQCAPRAAAQGELAC